MEYLYHGSSKNGLTEIFPTYTKGNAFKDKVSCYTSSFLMDILYIRNTPFHWVTYELDDSLEIVTYTESFSNMAKEMYSGVSGSVYCVNKNNPLIKESRFKNMFIANDTIIPDKVLYFNDVYEQIINLEKEGKIIIKTYDSLSDDEKEKIEDITYGAIIKERLVIDQWEKSKWVKKHFPKLWEKAIDEHSRKTHNEILSEIQKGF